MPAKRIDGIQAAQIEELQGGVNWLRFVATGLALVSLLLLVAVIILWFRISREQVKTSKFETGKVVELRDGSVTNSKIADNAISFNQLSPALQQQLNQLNQVVLNPVPGANGTAGSNGSAGAAGSSGIAIAQNGLSLSGSTLELGANPLLHDTAIVQDGSDFTFDATGAGGNLLALGTIGAGTDLAISGSGTRLMWYPKKAALRVGTVTSDDSNYAMMSAVFGVAVPTYGGTQWDNANIGIGSSVIGLDSVASGIGSSALGMDNIVADDYSMAIGALNYIPYAGLGGMNVAIGTMNVIDGSLNTSIGQGLGGLCDVNTANNLAGYVNLNFGNCNVISSIGSMTLGSDNNISAATHSLAVGVGNTVSGPGNSGAIGIGNTVSGGYALAMGVGLTVTGNNSFGLNVDNTTPATIANNNVIAFLGGDVGIGNVAPGYQLHVGDSGAALGAVARFENSGGTCDVSPDVAGGVTCTSDIRLKKDISEFTDALSKIGAINVVSYRYNVEDETDLAHIGVLAQELETVLPDLVRTDKEGIKSVSYAGLTPYLVQAVKEQNGKLEDVNKVLADQGLQINSLSEELKTLAGRVDQNTYDIEQLKARVKQLEDKPATTPTTPALTTQ